RILTRGSDRLSSLALPAVGRRGGSYPSHASGQYLSKGFFGNSSQPPSPHHHKPLTNNHLSQQTTSEDFSRHNPNPSKAHAMGGRRRTFTLVCLPAAPPALAELFDDAGIDL